MANTDRTTGTTGTGSSGGASDWSTDDAFWQSNYSTRPYASADRSYDHYRPAYRYGFESARHYVGRQWDEAEPDLRQGWEKYEHRGESPTAWDEIKHAVRDAWDRVVGTQRSQEPRKPEVRE